MNRYLLKGTGVGALGGLLFGFDTAVIAGATHQLTQVYSLSAGELGTTVAIALIGTVIGAMSAGAIGQKYGGRDTLRVMAVLYVISALGSGLAWSWPVLLVARFIGGLGIGGSSVLGPVYIAELAPRPVARTPGGNVSTQCRCRDPARLLLELHHRRTPYRGDAVALAARHRSISGDPLSDHALRHSSQLPLAGHPGPHRRSAPGAEDDGHT